MDSGKYLAYPDYIDSGTEWLSIVPRHWKILPLFAVASEKSERNKDNQEDNVLSLSYGRIIRRDVSLNFGLLPESFETYQIVQPNDIILRLTDLQNDKRSLRVGLVKERGIITSAYVCLSPDRLNPRYGYYLLHAFDVMKVFYSMGGGVRQTMRFEDLKHMPIPYPSLPEQRAIADFLDRETTRIDALIDAKQRLIDLLEEKRSALISHVVTKGLDPDAPMKDSEIEWLGEIPAHWEATRLKFLLTTPLQYGANESAEFEEQDWPRFIRITDITEEGTLREETFKSLPEEVATPYLLEDGDLLLARSGATVGKSFLYRDEYGEACFAGYLIRARVAQSEIMPKFLSYFTSSVHYWNWITGSLIQATIQNVSADKYANLNIPVPPRQEQIQIVEALELLSDDIDGLISKAKQVIDRLHEYRTALISAAVTGKIDVQGEL